MNKKYPWSANPGRKYFEILLAENDGHVLKRNGRYPAISFGSREKKALQTGIEKLPNGPIQLLLFHILVRTESPPTELHIKTPLLAGRGEKVPISFRIMRDLESLNLITGLAQMQMVTYDIKKVLDSLPLPPDYTLINIDRFLNQYWSVKDKEGWELDSNEYLRDLILSETELTDAFRSLLEGALSNKSRSDISLHYHLPFSPSVLTSEFRRSSEIALMKQNALLESDNYEDAETLSNVLSRTVNTSIKVGVVLPVELQAIPPILPEDD
ncbi:hypothetical protein HQ531_06630 [bacterium]|nr:hypothetical protein [bacterium]